MSIKSEARKDAAEYARAQMYYGEGAGTRRKLINTIVDHKSMNIPGYYDAFNDALMEQDMTEHAKKAKRERKHKDVSKRVDRNVRGLATGNKSSMTTDVMIAASVVYFAHQVGWDKEIWKYSKKKVAQVKQVIDRQRSRRRLRQWQDDHPGQDR